MRGALLFDREQGRSEPLDDLHKPGLLRHAREPELRPWRQLPGYGLAARKIIIVGEAALRSRSCTFIGKSVDFIATWRTGRASSRSRRKQPLRPPDGCYCPANE